MSLQQPIGQKRLTNVAVVRLKRHGIRFEIACYRNKVKSWREKVEKDIDEVLQSHKVFTNVSKGVLAKSSELLKAFNTDDHEKVCLEILEEGEQQVSDKERAKDLDAFFRDVACIISEKCVNPTNNRPYPLSMIERCMRDIHVNLDLKKSAKKQALEVIPLLEKSFPIMRAKMKVRLQVPEQHAKKLREHLRDVSAVVESTTSQQDAVSLVCLIDPGSFRGMETFVQEGVGGAGLVEVLSLSVHEEGDTHIGLDGDQVRKDGPAGASIATPIGASGDGVAGEGSLRDTTAGMQALSVQGGGARAASMAGGNAAAAAATSKLKCGTCNISFESPPQHREHFKSEWHRHNLKRKMKELPPLTEAECLADTMFASEYKDDEFCK
eukprot:jgi/Mesvir1/19103/Mv12850-RA.1